VLAFRRRRRPYRIRRGQRTDLTLRACVAYDTAAAPASWTRVDKDRRARTPSPPVQRTRTTAGVRSFGVALRHRGACRMVSNVSLANTTSINPRAARPLKPSLPEDRTNTTRSTRPLKPKLFFFFFSGYFVWVVGVPRLF
jgi:hypothetical protein